MIGSPCPRRTKTVTVLTTLDRETLRTEGVLVVEYGWIKQESHHHRSRTIRKRCQEHRKTSIHDQLGDNQEGFAEWVLHRLSRAIVEFTRQFSNPAGVFKNTSGIREKMQYRMHMNRRLHKFPFHKFETSVSYKTTWR
jgi:putative transposase